MDWFAGSISDMLEIVSGGAFFDSETWELKSSTPRPLSEEEDEDGLGRLFLLVVVPPPAFKN